MIFKRVMRTLYLWSAMLSVAAMTQMEADEKNAPWSIKIGTFMLVGGCSLAMLALRELTMRDDGKTKMTRGPKPKGRDGTQIRRRRMCINRHRFTTWERIGKVFTVKPSEIVSEVYA